VRRRTVIMSAIALGLAAWIGVGAWIAGRPARADQSSPALKIVRAEGTYRPSGSSKAPFTIMVLGSDARPGQPVETLRADSIHLVTVNPQRRAATIVGFPRDSWVNVPGHGSNKITVATSLGGPELMARTLEGLTGIHIDYYAMTAFEGFSNLVDGIGGITVDVPYRMSDSYSGAYFNPGPKHMSGGEALAFARDRHDVPGGDLGRSENHGRILLAALAQLRGDFEEDPAQLLGWIAVGARNVTTDLSLQELMRLGLAATRVPPSRVRNIVVPARVGSVGAASVVFVDGSANRIFADLRQDGVLGNN
jgi:LCP family protein required for cell wall assembly